ncbi:MAG: ribonuclease H [Polyangiaceae bacterium]
MPDFTCQTCQKPFTVSDEVLARFPGWSPKLCMSCKKNKSKGDARSETARRVRPMAGNAGTLPGAKVARGSVTRELDLPVAEILKRYTAGPDSGVFTDGAANPNPGPGGWGAVFVEAGHIRGELYGHEPHTTNNRMELLALRAGLTLVPSGTPATIYTDSQLCVNTFNVWAKSWKSRGWKRKDGAIKNLELVREIYEELSKRPELKLEWIAAHSGFRWNEYADALATAYRRAEK